MSDEKTNINWDLIAKHLTGETDGMEEAQLAAWLSSSETNRLYFENLEHWWQQTEQFALYSKIDVAADWQKVKQQLKLYQPASKMIAPRRIFSARFRKVFYAAAAVLLLGIMIPAGYRYMKPKVEQAAIQYVEAVTGRGEIKTIFLSDRTKVILNADSRIRYPIEFNSAERSVELQGEALFDVVPDSHRPFTVSANEINITVLGTVFDVKAYANDKTATVSVASGMVEVDLAGGKMLLEKNQQMKIDKASGNFEKLTIDADLHLSWVDGALYFYRTPVKEVVNMLNRYYPQIDIELADDDYSILISGKHDNKRLEAVLTSIIYTTGLKYKKTGNKFILYQDK
ncbi:MAG: FecR domain-containing protein [Prolixibacteraceae bacterium]|nr:FecR domain-containing protein [Prolixibacteraceae bacterium]